MTNHNPSPSTRFQPGKPRPKNAGMKKGYKYLTPLLWNKLKKEIKGKNETVAEGLIKNTIFHASRGDAALIKLIFDKIDGNNLTMSLAGGSGISQAEKKLLDKIAKLDKRDQKSLMKILDKVIETRGLRKRGKQFKKDILASGRISDKKLISGKIKLKQLKI